MATHPKRARNSTEPHGMVKLGNYEKNPEFYGILAHPFGFLSASPARGGFVYFSYHFRVGCWVLMATLRNVPRNPTESHGTPRNPAER